MKKKILLGLSALMLTSSMYAEQNTGYISAVASTLSVDGGTDTDFTGLEFKSLKDSDGGTFLKGAEFTVIQPSEGFDKGGIADLALNIGKSFGGLKIYANLGYGIQVIEYADASVIGGVDNTTLGGFMYGLNIDYDIGDNFAIFAGYRSYSLEETQENNRRAKFSYDLDGTKFGISFRY